MVTDSHLALPRPTARSPPPAAGPPPAPAPAPAPPAPAPAPAPAPLADPAIPGASPVIPNLLFSASDNAFNCPTVRRLPPILIRVSQSDPTGVPSEMRRPKSPRFVVSPIAFPHHFD